MALPILVEEHNGRDPLPALRRISYAGTLMDSLRKHRLLTSALLLLLTSAAGAHHGRQFTNFNTFNKTLTLLNQCPFHRSDIQGVRGKTNMGSVRSIYSCEKDTVRSTHLPSSSQKLTGRQTD